MKVRLYAVFDSKLATFGSLHVCVSDGQAFRQFSDFVNDGRDERNNLFKHPEDFSLFYVGDFVEESGELVRSTPVSLCTASAVKRLPGDSQVLSPPLSN